MAQKRNNGVYDVLPVNIDKLLIICVRTEWIRRHIPPKIMDPKQLTTSTSTCWVKPLRPQYTVLCLYLLPTDTVVSKVKWMLSAFSCWISLPPQSLSKNAVAFVCLYSLNTIRCTNRGNSAHFGTLQRCQIYQIFKRCLLSHLRTPGQSGQSSKSSKIVRHFSICCR